MVVFAVLNESGRTRQRHALLGAMRSSPTIERLEERLQLDGDSITFREDFSTSSLNAAVWSTPTGPASYYPRTQIRAPDVPVGVDTGAAHLRLDTFNPTARMPGDSFYGSEIISNRSFAPTLGTELVFEARVRADSPFPRGIVDAFFLYSLDPGGATRNEIDFELLGNEAANQRVLTNSFHHDNFGQPGDKALAGISGLNLTGFNTFRINWSATHIQWFINDRLVREKCDNVPTEPMQIHLNTWAPDNAFTEAFDDGLHPAASQAANQAFLYDVDYVTVRTIRDVNYHDVVQNLYQSVLSRPSDPAGADFWFGQLTSGMKSVGEMASGFFESDERLNPLIRQMYRDYLFREADDAGLAYWRDMVWKRDGGPDNVIAGIVSSDEFFRSAGDNNRVWVAAAYQRLLHRAADPEGLDFWTSQLDNHVLNRQQVVLGFVRSREDFRNLVSDWFAAYLRRAPGPADFAFFTGQLEAGVSQRDVQIELLNSDEFASLPPA